jgi:hypothetical protein
VVGDTAGLGDLSHLHESARALARLPDSDRLRHVRAERWIGYSRANEALARLQTLVQWPDRQRMPNLLLIGPTNNGKSMIIEKFCRTHPPVSHPNRKEIPVLTVQMPSIGGPTVAWSLLAVERLVLRRLREVRVRVLVIDELHNVLAGRSDRRREFLKLIRFLGNQLRIPLVGVGTREAYLAIRSDDQLENRFEPFVLPRWQTGAEACSLLASFAASFPLRRGARAGAYRCSERSEVWRLLAISSASPTSASARCVIAEWRS